ncbi:protein of unknown function [Nitratireductor aquimarinus]
MSNPNARDVAYKFAPSMKSAIFSRGSNIVKFPVSKKVGAQNESVAPEGAQKAISYEEIALNYDSSNQYINSS